MALLDPQVRQNAHMPITPEEAKKALSNDGIFSDDAAIKLVIQDTLRAENFESQKSWVLHWPSASILYQSPFTSRYWEGTQVERANVPVYTVATIVNSLCPQIIKGLFYDEPPFLFQKRPKTPSQAARAISEIIAYQLKEINFEQEINYGVINCLLFGTAMWKYGWENYSRERKVYVRKKLPTKIANPPFKDIEIHEDEDDEIEEETITENIDQPSFENIVNLRQVLVDPGLNIPDIRKAKYVVHRMYKTFEELDRMRDRPGMNIPTREELLELFLPPKEPVEEATSEVALRNPLWDSRAAPRYDETTIDPFNQPLEVLERWDNEKVIMVLQKKKVICNDKNPYGKIPFFSVGWWDVSEAFWSMGLAKTIGSEQRLQQGIINAWLDGVTLNLNGIYKRKKGKSVPTQSIRISPGKIVEVDDMDDFEPLQRLPAVPEALAAIQQSEARAERFSGANELITQGASPAPGQGRTSMGRTAGGASLLASGTNDRIGDFIRKLSNQVFIPFLHEVHSMNKTLLPAKTIRTLLDQELQTSYDDYSGDIIVDILNAEGRFNILAAAKLSARRNMAQALPILLQFLEGQPIQEALQLQGKKVDTAELIRMFFEVSEWRNYNDVVVDMTPQDQQRMQQMNPGAQKIQGQAALQNQKFGQQQQLIDQENVARAGREILRQAIEQSAGAETVTGNPTGTGFGANVG